LGLARRQRGFHQPEALVIVHMRPSRDLGGSAMTAQTQAFIIERTYAYTGTEHRAEKNIHGLENPQPRKANQTE